MDLGLINHKLVNDEYEGREQFVEDLRLVFSNAVEFNRPAAQQAQSQKELNPHFVMDDLAAKKTPEAIERVSADLKLIKAENAKLEQPS